MADEKIEFMVEGGKAAANAQISQKLGPMKINIAEVMKKINEKTSDMSGMQVPVKLLIDIKTKEYKIDIGTPPVAELIKKELSLEKGSATPNTEKKGNLGFEQIIKIAKIKQASMFTNSLKSAVKSVIGSAASMGVLVEGKTPLEINPEVINGQYDTMIKEEKTEISADKKELLNKQLEEVNKRLKKELERLKAEEEAEKAAVVAPTAEVKVEGEVKAEGEAGKSEAGKIAPGVEVKAGAKPEAGKTEAKKPEAKPEAKKK